MKISFFPKFLSTRVCKLNIANILRYICKASCAKVCTWVTQNVSLDIERAVLDSCLTLFIKADILYRYFHGLVNLILQCSNPCSILVKPWFPSFLHNVYIFPIILLKVNYPHWENIPAEKFDKLICLTNLYTLKFLHD